MVCIFGLGSSCGSSSSASTKILNDTTNQSVTNILNTNATTVSTNTITNQSVNFTECSVNPDKFRLECPGGLNISQITTANVNIITNITDESAQQIREVLAASIDANAAAEAKAETGFFVTSTSVAVSATDIQNHLHNLLETTLTNQNIRNIINGVSITQAINIPMCGTWVSERSCNFSQNVTLSIIADQIISSFNQAVIDDSFLADITVQAGSSSDSSTAGFDAIIRALTEFFGNVVFAYIFFVLGVLLILFLVFWVATRGLTSIFARKPSSASPQVNTETPSTKK